MWGIWTFIIIIILINDVFIIIIIIIINAVIIFIITILRKLSIYFRPTFLLPAKNHIREVLVLLSFGDNHLYILYLPFYYQQKIIFVKFLAYFQDHRLFKYVLCMMYTHTYLYIYI